MENKKSDMSVTSTTSDKSGNSDGKPRNTYRRGRYNRGGKRDHRGNDRSSERNSSDFRKNRGSYRGGFRDNSFGKRPFKRTWSNTQHDGKRKKLEVSERLKECDVGITEFIGNCGFFGIIKERYTDFHVNEIDLNGQVAVLTNQDIPLDVEENESIEDLKKTVSNEIWEQLQTLKETDALPIEIDVTSFDKDQRRTIHSIAKQITNVISQTIDKDNKKIMVIQQNKKDSKNSQNIRRDKRVDWKKRGGEYCHFLLHKVNMDTMDALNQIAMSLRMKPNNFNYAGTKDRRAWTTQWVSLRKVEPSDILRVAKTVRGAYVGNFKYAEEALRLGMLRGNRFRIGLRNVTGTDEEIEEAMISLRDNGFINYYGLQRFGTVAAIPTYEIGKALLQGNWNEAIELILKPREGEQDEDLLEARKIYETTKDAYAAYAKIKRSDKIEATLLKGIQTSGINNPQGALDSIPRNTRLMYIHAYQSFVWNHMVSRRIKEFGKNPIVGDLVYEKNTKQLDNVDDTIYETEHELSDQGIENEDCKDSNQCTMKTGETSQIPEEVTSVESEDVTSTEKCSSDIDGNVNVKDSNEKNENEESTNLPAVKILTEEDLPNYTLADVLMPQVGWKVTYPPYAKPWYEEFLAKDGLTIDLRQKNKKYSLGGAYRKILQIPSDLSWNIVRYKERHSDLISCDIDKMRKLPSPKDEPDGQYKALIVEFSLKSSTYATMALREILKLDTSPQAQAAQSAACLAKTTDAQNEDISKDDNECKTAMQVDSNDTKEEKSLKESVTTDSDVVVSNSNDDVNEVTSNKKEVTGTT